jgi:hypothetical protein
LWVRDGGNGRYQAYRLEADRAVYDREVRMQHGDRNLGAPLTFDTAGRLVDVGHVPDTATGSTVLARYHVTLDGTVRARDIVPDPSPDSIDMTVVDRKTARGAARLYAYKPFGSLPLVTHGPRGAWATAASGYYAVRWVLPEGTTRVVSRDLAGPALSDQDVRLAEENLAATAKWLGTTVGRLPFGVPDRKAPIQALWFDRTGRLWVNLTRQANTENRADVYDTSGTRIAVARWPGGVDLRSGYVDDEVALGVARDSLGVERVSLLTWSR